MGDDQAAMNHGRLTKREWTIVGVNIINLGVFGVVALWNRNSEFLLYIGVVVVVVAVLFLAQPRIRLSEGILWGLTLWSILHLSGGNIRIQENVLYSMELIPVILRYDQLVHAFGFGVSTMLCYHLLKPSLRPDQNRWGIIAFLTILMGCGIGAINEIVEFLAVKTVPQTNVGGYDNTLLDMVFNLIGAMVAVAWLSRKWTISEENA